MGIQYGKVVKDFLEEEAPKRLREPFGNLQHPYVDPGAGYANILWDWDSYFCCLGMEELGEKDERVGIHVRGCVDNFLERQGPDGHIPYSNTPKSPARVEEPRSPDSDRNSCKPLLAQFSLLALRLGSGDTTWLKQVYPGLARSVDHWFEAQGTALGLLTWRSHRGSGADNNPAYFQRPHDSVADPYLNAMMVMELRALADIASRIGESDSKWKERTDELSSRIERYLWDPIDETYYCIDVGRGDPGKVRTECNWVVPLKFRTWGMVMPLWAQVASRERASAVIEKHVLREDQLRSPHGLRSLAKVEPAYQIFANYNPSDWLGPVWIVSTYLGWEALRSYGFDDEAASLAKDLLTMMARDIEKNGCLHEYYEPETGEGLTHPGFMNWNTLALRMISTL